MTPKRLAIVLPNLQIGGVERLSISLATEFSQQGIEVTFVLMQAQGELLNEARDQFDVVDLNSSRIRSAYFPLRRWIIENKPDAVLAAIWPLTVLGVLAAAGTGTRVVISDHNPLSLQYASRGKLHRLFLRLSLAVTYRYAHARVAVSRGVTDDLARLSGLPSDIFTTVHNPIQLEPASTENVDASLGAWKGTSGVRILSVGRLKSQKNYPLLFRAFAKLREQINAHLVVLGTGEKREELISLIHELNLNDEITLAGHVSNPASYYRHADLFVLSSDYEGFGNVLIEAMVCGTPVVSTDCPSGPAEILENGKWGRLAPVGDAEALCDMMIAELDDPHAADALKKRAADFSPEIAARTYVDLLFPDAQQLAQSDARKRNMS